MASETLSGDIEKVVNHSADTGWGVIRVRIDDGRSVTMVGSVVRADEGLRVEAEGNWVTHPAFGPQFKADAARLTGWVRTSRRKSCAVSATRLWR